MDNIMGKTVNDIRKEYAEARNGKKEEITIDQLRSSYAVRVKKIQIEAFKELDKKIKEMFNDMYETIKKEILEYLKITPDHQEHH